jgi:hypothetical protein
MCSLQGDANGGDHRSIDVLNPAGERAAERAWTEYADLHGGALALPGLDHRFHLPVSCFMPV